MTAPRVSVLMPVYNGGEYLAAALDSILSQSLAELELVAVDDGSTDGSAGLLATRAAGDPRLVIVTNPRNLGLTHSLNRGLAVCRGAYIARQDADDLSAPGRLARQAEYLDAHAEIGVLATAIAIVDADGGVRRERYFEDKLTNAELQAGLLVDYCIGHGSVMMRRQALDAVGGYDAAMEPAEDHDLWLRLAEVTQLACLPDALYSYRHLGTSVSRTRRSQQVLRVAQAIENALRRRCGPAPSADQLFPA
ncbi:MAG: glycosyltransferase, partial [Anaerolineales bacterium]